MSFPEDHRPCGHVPKRMPLLRSTPDLLPRWIQATDEVPGIHRSANLGVVVEIDIDVASSGTMPGAIRDAFHPVGIVSPDPGPDPRRPSLQRGIVIAADVKLLGAMQPAIDEVAGQIHDERPVDAVGTNEGHAVPPQQVDEYRRTEAVVPDLQRMPQWSAYIAVQPVAPVEPCIVTACELPRGFRVLRQQGEEGLQNLRIEGHARRQLPEDGAQLRPESQHARCHEVREWRLDVLQPQHVSDVARPLYGEN